MDPDEFNPLFLIIDRYIHKTMLSKRILIHGNLVSLGKVRVKIVLPSEEAVGRDPAGGRKP